MNSEAVVSSSILNVLREKNHPATLRAICEEACHILEAERAMVSELSFEKGEWRREIVYAHNLPLEYLEALREKKGQTLFEEVCRRGDVEVISEPASNRIFLNPKYQNDKRILGAGHRAICIIPLARNGRVFGGICLYHLYRRDYTFDERRLARIFGEWASVAVEKSKDTASLGSRVEEHETLKRTLRCIASGEGLSDIFQAVWKAADKVMGTSRSSVEWFNDESDEISFHGCREISPHYGDRLASLETPFPITRSYLQDADHNTPTVIPDTSAHRLTGEIQISEGLRSMVAFPLRVEGRTKGSLMFYWTFPREFGGKVLGLGQAISDQVAISLHQAFQKESSQYLIEQLQQYASSASKMDSPLDPVQIGELAARSGARLMEAQRWCVFLAQSDGEFRCVASDGLSRWQVQDLENSSEFARWYRGEGELPDFQTVTGGIGGTEVEDEFSDRGEIRSRLFLPLQSRERKKGVIVYYFDRPFRPGQRRLQIAQSFGEQAALALENTRLFHQVKEQVKNLETVGRITRTISSKVGLDALLRAAVREIRHVVPCDRCVISTVSGEDRQVECWYIDSDVPGTSDEDDALEVGAWFYREVYESGRLRNIPDLQGSGLYWAGHLLELGVQSLLVVPILHGDSVIAHVAMSSLHPYAFSSDHEDLVTGIADHLGAAIKNASLFHQAEERAGRYAALGRIAKVAGSALEPDEICNRLLREIRVSVECDRLALSVGPPREGWDLDPYVDSKIEWDASGEDDEARRRWLSREIYEPGETRNISRLHSSELSWKKGLIDAGFRSSLFVPVLLDGQSIAHLELHSTKEGAFGRAQEDFLRSAAEHLGPAIQNAHLFRKTIKHSFRLRQLHELNCQIGCSLNLADILSGLNRASINLVGGDFFQLFLVEEPSKILVPQSPIGEVSFPREPFAPLLGVMRTVVESGESVLLADLQRDPRFLGIEWAFQTDLHSFMAHPLFLGKKIFGAICCVSRNRNLFDSEDLEIFKCFADSAAVMIYSAILYERERSDGGFFQSVVEDNSDAIFAFNSQRRVIVWNPAAEKLYGFSQSEALGALVENLILPKEECSALEEKAEGVFSKGEVWQFEAGRKNKDGALIPVSIALSPVRGEDGEVVAASEIHHSLKWREQAEAALKESEERFRLFVQHAGDAFIVHDLGGKIVEVNKQASRCLGYERGEFLSLNVDDISLDYGTAESRAQWEVIRSGKPVTIESPVRRKDGSIFPAEVRLGAFVLNDRPHFLALVRDVSDRKQTEAALREAVSNAEAANQAKREFLSNMSHELRSPLNLITGFSDILMMEAKERQVLDIVPKIQKSAKHLASLIEDMIDMDRIERGEVNLKRDVFSINKIVNAMVETQRPHLRAGFAIECILDPSEPQSFCDETRVNQILINLLDNAIHYSPNGGKIRIQTSVQEQEVWISVQDEGVGLTEEEKGKIFDRFFRLSQSKKRRPGGMGIGLDLVRELVRVQEGRIWVTGEKGIGSTFTFSLPLYVPEDVEDRDSIHGPSGNGHHLDSGENGRLLETSNPWDGRVILVADDDEEHHLFIRKLLESAAKVISVFNGLEVGEWVQTDRPDIILMDIRMPTLDGLMAVDNLKSNPGTRDIPILVVTAHATSQDRENAFQMGADGFLGKPLDIDDFKLEMGRLIGSGS